MKILNSSKGVGGILGGFRGLVGDSKKITFIGTPGFCTPFAELMGFVLRGSGKELTFISNLNFNVAKTMISKEDGMQLGKVTDPHADTVVLLGGVAMPKMAIDPEAMNKMILQVLEGSERKLVIGVCFQSVFQEQKWTDKIDFDYIVDSDLSVDLIEI
ncbi:MAG: DUF2124 domain-containing protein [Methanosarcinaceae archaeon]|nr:DUF2124 domain-containing protein [Methanosarcinaceae archaeon]